VSSGYALSAGMLRVVEASGWEDCVHPSQPYPGDDAEQYSLTGVKDSGMALARCIARHGYALTEARAGTFSSEAFVPGQVHILNFSPAIILLF
jgi:hypothetical protein